MVSYRHAQVLALLIVAAMTAISLTAPPFIAYDPAFGLTRWYGLLHSTPFDTAIGPDPADISRDIVQAASWWSPGQYLVPGLLTLTGLRLGTALVMIAGLCNLTALLGWITVARAFDLGPRVALAATLLIATFRFSSSAYGIYSGGEILLQAVTPWIVLAAWRLPHVTLMTAMLIAFVATAIGFLAKLNGLIVVASAFGAAGMLAMVQARRLTPGLIGGVFGALIAVALVYVFWFAAKPVTHFTGGGQGFGFVRAAFALSAPWTSALSWQDFIVWLTQTPRRVILHDDAALVLIGLLPVAVLLAAALAFDRNAPENERVVRRFSLLMLGGFTLLMLVLYLRGAPIPLEERHFRPVGMLLFLCLLAMALRPGIHRGVRYALLALFSTMSMYGLASFSARVMSAQQQTVERYSWTLQPNADASSLAAIQQAFATEGRDALFYLGAPELIATLPPNARIIVEAPALMSDASISAVRYKGRVKGHMYLLLSNTLPAEKREAILRSFADYDTDKWSNSVSTRATLYSQ
ncbi:MAG: hypothetical protein Q7T81_10805 [Pseudolabrys sp.]|nr:hypothetical protein [Pseudolabrys sp.]